MRVKEKEKVVFMVVDYFFFFLQNLNVFSILK